MKYSIISVVALLAMMLVGGCFSGYSSGNSSPASQVVVPENPQQALMSTVSKTDIFLGLFMMALVGGVIVGLSGFKMGWVVAGGNLIGIFLHLTIARYGHWMAVFGLLASLVAVGAMLLYNRKFKFQHIEAIQHLKDRFPNLREQINSVLSLHQDSHTRKEVIDIKSKMKKRVAKKGIVHVPSEEADGGGRKSLPEPPIRE